MINVFPEVLQTDEKDCGPVCLKMIAKYYGKNYSIRLLRERAKTTAYGTTLFNLSDAAESIGFKTLLLKLTFSDLKEGVKGPCIIHWNQNHFVVMYKIKRGYVYIADPAAGKVRYSITRFLESWIADKKANAGVAMLLENNNTLVSTSEGENKIGLNYFFSFFTAHRKQYVQVILGLICMSFISFVSPFVTQSIVDVGINGKNLSFVQIMLLGQLVLAVSSMLVGFVQSWLFLNIGAKISISIAVNYIAKILKLRVPFLESKTVGDFIQRMSDNSRIQSFISNTLLNTIFSLFIVIVYSIILASYNTQILVIFIIGNVLYAIWLILFIKKRKALDQEGFLQSSKLQTLIIQIFSGAKDIKLYNYEKEKRWEWEGLQAKSFKVSVKQLSLSQIQQSGVFAITQSKNIIITFLVTVGVINGDITLGMMMSIQYILGQMNGPFNQLVTFINSYQDMKISLDRIGEIHGEEEEDPSDQSSHNIIPEIGFRDIKFQNVTFGYSNSQTPVIKHVNLMIPEGKTTAIVGESGSGKTTILKLLLKFYKISEGEIYIGDQRFSRLLAKDWRRKCGAILQDSYLFNDSILNNITLNEPDIDMTSVYHACRIANIHEFIMSLPHDYETAIGDGAYNLSQGQKQRVLLARLAYRKPDFIFLDEATSALDIENEMEIMKNISEEFRGKTVIVVSHRLSPIIHFDNIVVFKDGQVIEEGKHEHLLHLEQGSYKKMFTKQTLPQLPVNPF